MGAWHRSSKRCAIRRAIRMPRSASNSSRRTSPGSCSPATTPTRSRSRCASASSTSARSPRAATTARKSCASTAAPRPELYLEVVPIARRARGARARRRRARAIEYAVKMRRFAAGRAARPHGAARRARRRADRRARRARSRAFHAACARAGARRRLRRAAQASRRRRSRNFDQIEALGRRRRRARLARAARLDAARVPPARSRRSRRASATGCVRECHGDLHLGNIALLDGRADALRLHRVQPGAALDRRHERGRVPRDGPARAPAAARSPGASSTPTWRRPATTTGSRVLRFYLVYRAMVRAKVRACARTRPASTFGRRYVARSREHLRWRARARRARRAGAHARAVRLGQDDRRRRRCSRALGAVRLRSDVERKRLHGLAPQARTGLGAGRRPLRAGRGPAHLRAPGRARRRHPRRGLSGDRRRGVPASARGASRSARLAGRRGALCVIAPARAPEATLRAARRERAARARDASEAGVAVLEHQLAAAEPLAPDELAMRVTRRTRRRGGRARRASMRVAARLAGPEESRLRRIRRLQRRRGRPVRAAPAAPCRARRGASS